MDSILTSIKKLLGIAEEYTHFDADIVMHINSVFMILTQMGVGPRDGFRIEDASATWDDFTNDSVYFEAIKTYMHHKVRLMFDPPQSSVAMEAANRVVNELEWRLYAAAETSKLRGEEEIIQNG